MNYKVITLFPELFNSFKEIGLIKKAQEKRLLAIHTIQLRQFGIGKHQKVDDKPYGGRSGMLFRPEPVYQALEYCDPEHKNYRILLTTDGYTLNQKICTDLVKQKELVFVCPRYEGFDSRLRKYVDLELSIGDFILMGGELVAMMVIESTARLIPGVLGNKDSLQNESFENALLQSDQFTKPFEFIGDKVPETLLSGNHQKIAEWQKNNAIAKTQKRRKDLYKKIVTD